MDASSRTLGEDPWLSHAQALRCLAAALVHDEGEALDLVHETWIRSGTESRSGAWLRTVLRNLARDRVRERERRRWTEQNAARAERLPSSAEIVGGLELAQLLAREVAALDEPCRLVVHLRYFEALAPEEIAERCRLPLETVRTRLKRGLARLRERLDRSHGGDRRAWATVLLPLARGAGLGGTGAGLAATVVPFTLGMKLLTSTAAVALLGTGIFLWRRSAGPAAGLDGGATAPAPQVALREVPSPTVEIEAREPVTPSNAGSAPTTAPAPTGTRTVEGMVVIVDERGAEHARESGTLSVATGTATDFSKHELAVVEGRFRVELRPGDSIVFGRLVAGEREAALPEPRPIQPGAEPLVVRGQWQLRGRLRVIDSVSRQELAGIELRCADGWRAIPRWTHPGDHPSLRTVLREGVSPLDLPDRTRPTLYWVHAPGHAWASVTFDHRAGGERSLELSPLPSVVSVSAQGEVPAEAFVRLYPLDGVPIQLGDLLVRRPPADELPSWQAGVSVRADPAGTTRIVDLQGGRYLASIEVGEYEERLRLGSAEVDVPEGGSATVSVRVDPRQLDLPRTHLHGTLRVPEGLAREQCGLTLRRLEGGEKEFQQPLDRMSFARDAEDLLRWDAGPMRTGRYVASFDALQYREIFETEGAGSETVVDFVLPPLVTVRIEVVDRATGAPLEAKVTWHGPALPGLDRFTLGKVMRDPATGALQFVTARGPIEVSASSAGYLDGTEELELTGPTATCRLELERATGVRVVMREGEATLPVDSPYFHGIRVTRRDGTHVPGGRWVTGATALIPLEPDAYVLEFPPLEGFEPLASRAVLVAAGEVVEVVVSAVRKR